MNSCVAAMICLLGSALLAASPAHAAMVADDGMARIVNTHVRVTDDTVEIRLRSDRTIPSFQRPECIGKTAILRIADVVHADTSMQSICRSSRITAAVEKIRNISVYRFTAPFTVAWCTARRDGPRDLILTLSSVQQQHVAEATPPGESGKQPPKDRAKWSLDVIVIDAGHGGVDAGAEGVNGVYEKDVTLAIARTLRTLMKTALPSTEVVMTRDSDVFVELYRRTQIANEHHGKLFISIHCNSMPTKPHPAHGCETYILRPGRNDDAARVAARENASVQFERSQSPYAGMTQDQVIVATMAQRSFVQLSEKLASLVQREVSKATPIEDRGVSQAGFFVLVGASMPNILFETAFLSNTSDAAYISSARGQHDVATAMLNAITAYATSYRSLLDK